MNNKNNEVKIIGAGLAGSEAALQLSKRGIKVKLFEMRPNKSTGAHTTNYCAEFVCSNSLGSIDVTNASGLLKKEMELIGGELIKIAKEHSVPAGNALAISREDFSHAVTKRIEQDENIELVREEVTSIPDGNVIIATGPLTSDLFANCIQEFTKSDYLHFYDAIAPIVEIDSINFDKAFWGSRYDKGEAAYINCPMNKEEYENFYNTLINAPRIENHEVDKKEFFESCLPIEVLASRGIDTLRYGPMKPVGLIDKRNGAENYAVVQLRQDNSAKTLFNLVGFQTNLKWGAQKELVHSIPGLEEANIVRYGVMHRNTFINSSVILNPTFETIARKGLFFAGQITGTEGYTESIAGGLLAGINMARRLSEREPVVFPKETMLGALTNYVTDKAHLEHISKRNGELRYLLPQPINSNWAIVAPIELSPKDRKNKKVKTEKLAERSIYVMRDFIAGIQ